MNATLDIPQDAMPAAKAARMIGVSPATLSRWIRLGEIRAWKKGHRHFVSEADVRARVRPYHVMEPAETTRTPEQIEADARAAIERIQRKGW